MRNDEERLLFSRGTGLQHRFIRDIVMGLQLERLYQLPSTEKALSSTAVLQSMAPTLCRYDEERLLCIADLQTSIWLALEKVKVLGTLLLHVQHFSTSTLLLLFRVPTKSATGSRVRAGTDLGNMCTQIRWFQ